MIARKPQDILKEIEHRPFPIPTSHWTLYSEWKDVLMLHWKVDASIAKQLIPPSLSIDTFEGGAWITMSILTVDNFKTRLLSLIGGKIKFDQILFHTYVIRNGKPGIYIFRQEVEKSNGGQFYQKVLRRPAGNLNFYKNGTGSISASNAATDFEVNIHYKLPEAGATEKGTSWFTNRFKYYYSGEKRLLALVVHHLEMQVQPALLQNYSCKITIGNLNLNHPPDAAFYSEGIQKLTWPTFAIK